jgi:hypothetical protein
LNFNGLLGGYFTTRCQCTLQALYRIARSGMLRQDAAAVRYTAVWAIPKESTRAEPDPIELEVRQRGNHRHPYDGKRRTMRARRILMLAGKIKQSASKNYPPGSGESAQ